MLLYGNALSTYTARVRIALSYKSIEHEEKGTTKRLSI